MDETGTNRSPITPHPRQQEFLDLDCEEAMLGGALGGGKTECLLEWLRHGVVHDGFSGLFLRRTYAQLGGSPTSPINRSRKFFMPHGGVFNSTEKVWNFPNGAMVAFGHCQHVNDVYNYDGHEFHRIAVDQVEGFTQFQYEYLFSRLRRVEGYPIPCGMRSSANPHGGPWVRQRFVSNEAIQELKQYTALDPSPPGMMFKSDCGAIFMPSRVADNPTINTEEYVARLRTKLGAKLAAQLANGDWSAVEGAVIDPDHLRYYALRGCIIVAKKADGDDYAIIDERQCRRFATVDTAGTSRHKAAEDKGRPASWSVCCIWDHWPQTNFLFLRHVWRERVEWNALKNGIAATLKQWHVPVVIIENAHHGPPLASELKGVRAELVNPNLPGMKQAGEVKSAKQERAIASGLLTRIEAAEVYLPEKDTVPGVAGWLPECESEILSWTGRPDEPADQIDAFSYAANHTKKDAVSWGGVIN